MLAISLLGASSAPQAQAEDLAPYRNPVYATALQDLLTAKWPNQFSTAESALGTSGVDLSIRDGLFRTRGEARTFPRLGVTDGLNFGSSRAWRVYVNTNVGRKFAQITGDPGFGQPTFNANLTTLRWLATCRMASSCPDMGSASALGLPIYNDPGSTVNRGWWILNWLYQGGWGARLWRCPAYGWTPSNHFCQQRDVDTWNWFGEPNQFNAGGRLVAATNDDGSTMDCDNSSVVEPCYYRVQTVWEMSDRMHVDRFENWTTQTYEADTDWRTYPQTYDADAARNELDRQANWNARAWINNQLDPNYPDPRLPQAIVSPQLSGLFYDSETVSSSPGQWSGSPTAFTYQWQRCNSVGASCSDIGGETNSTYRLSIADVGHSVRTRVRAFNSYGSSEGFSEATVVNSLLARYVPELRYDSQETYRADSAAEITDNFQTDYENTLKDAAGATLTGASPTHDPRLSLEFLGSYLPGEADYLDEANSYAADAARLHSDPTYKNQVYGREVPLPAGKILQYWFFYYYNSKTFFGAGAHEGDWEMVQVHLNASNNPVETVLSQHDHAEVCDWARVNKSSEGRPAVYVAEGSHANYYTAGSHEVIEDFAYDTVDGFGGNIVPTLNDVTAFEPAWMSWPGRWGASIGAGPSPLGPKQHEAQWNNPSGWAATQNGCSLSGALRSTRFESTHLRPHSSPPLPRLQAKIVGNRLRIRYAFSSFPDARDRQPWQLVTSVQSASRAIPPVTIRSRIHRPNGTVLRHLGPGRGPYRLLVSVRSAAGTRTRVLRLALH
jgi:hypothetical protein